MCFGEYKAAPLYSVYSYIAVDSEKKNQAEWALINNKISDMMAAK